MNQSKKIKKSLIFGGIALIILVFGIGYLFGIVTGRISGEGIFYDSYIGQFGFDGYVSHYGWEAVQLRPIEKVVQSDLCMRFDIPLEDPLCDPDNTVTDPDFFPIINDTFKSKNQERASYDEVQSYLGPYNYDGCSTYHTGYTYGPETMIDCRYSLSGSKITVFTIQFDASTGILYNIFW